MESAPEQDRLPSYAERARMHEERRAQALAQRLAERDAKRAAKARRSSSTNSASNNYDPVDYAKRRNEEIAAARRAEAARKRARATRRVALDELRDLVEGEIVKQAVGV